MLIFFRLGPYVLAFFCFYLKHGSGITSGGSKICLLGGSSPFFFLQPPFLLPPSFLSSSSPSFLPLFSMVFWGVGGLEPPQPPCASATGFGHVFDHVSSMKDKGYVICTGQMSRYRKRGSPAHTIQEDAQLQ